MNNLTIWISKNIFYLYTPNGTKLRVQTGHALSQQTKDYIDNMIYENRNLSFILMPEGRIVPDSAGNTYAYEYFIKDHLGNTRAIIDHNSQILEHTAYYPFGMPIAALSYTATEPQNKYLYNGKWQRSEHPDLSGELQDNYGLDWIEYGFRYYDAQVARWHSVDPIIEKHYDYSGYAYTYNNPILNMDYMGLDTVPAAMNTLSPLPQINLDPIIIKPDNTKKEDKDENKEDSETDNKKQKTQQKDNTPNEKSLLFQFAEKADDWANSWGPSAAQFLMDINPIYTVLNTGKTIITGKDIQGNTKIGGERYLSPIISVGLAIIPTGKYTTDQLLAIPMTYFLDNSQQKAIQNITRKNDF